MMYITYMDATQKHTSPEDSMSRYQIENTTSGATLGTWTADSEQAALDAMAREAGYKDHADCERQVGAAELTVTEID